jgi:membrane associated rhomboid family serine protease
MCPTLQLLLWVVVATLAWFFILLARQRNRPRRGFALLVLGNLALGSFALATRAACGLPGLLALFVFGMLVVLPGLLRLAEARALLADRLVLASWLCGLRALLQPGTVPSRELSLRRALSAMRRGRAEEVLEALRKRIAATAQPAERAWLAEHLMLLLAQERRYDEAVREYEAAPLPLETRPALGATLVRAYCERGDLARAGEVLGRLEDSPVALDLGATNILNQARLIFLAHAGEAAVVGDLLAGGSAFLPALSAPVRSFWLGTASLHAGALASARAAFQRGLALAQERGDPRMAASCQTGLARVGAAETGATAVPTPTTDPQLRALVAKAAERARQVIALPRPHLRLRQAPVTLALALTNLAVFFAGKLVDPDPDAWTLIRWGANFHPAVRAGEWWRLSASMFLHANLLHIGINVYILVLLGRLVEQLFGRGRFLLLYAVAGVCGSVASVLGGRGALSIGASGAILGIVGGLVGVLLVGRSALPQSFRRTLLGNLLILLLLQVIVDWNVELIDNWAHLGGLFGGLLVGLGFSPDRRAGATPRRVGELVGWVVGGALLAWGAVGVARADLGATARRLPRRPMTHDGVTLEVPDYFRPQSDGWEDGLGLVLTVDVHPLPEGAEGGGWSRSRDALSAQLDREIAGTPGLRREAAPGLAPPGMLELALSSPLREPRRKGTPRVLELLFLRDFPAGQFATVHFRFLFDRLPIYAPLIRSMLPTVGAAAP